MELIEGDNVSLLKSGYSFDSKNLFKIIKESAAKEYTDPIRGLYNSIETRILNEHGSDCLDGLVNNYGEGNIETRFVAAVIIELNKIKEKIPGKYNINTNALREWVEGLRTSVSKFETSQNNEHFETLYNVFNKLLTRKAGHVSFMYLEPVNPAVSEEERIEDWYDKSVAEVLYGPEELLMYLQKFRTKFFPYKNL